ncbi:MAG: allophanate hydrolase [Oceanospirillaceae bacterium]|uniref:allophanate hydrolase n=1 Tax=unclassified Thalassolituus TaxID=2624967 RepID=UPI000C649973|nr:MULTISPECIES: allophanate hydrolase [unclassified Thalassolituus]MBS53913.1 allophanate hydrolase [Oceanospirillaceae bacterium]
MSQPLNLSLSYLKAAYASGELTPSVVIDHILDRAAEYEDYNIWITRLTKGQIQRYLDALKDKDPAKCPLWGVPFAIKDNIDLAGIPTTAACKEFAYTPDDNAFLIQQLINAGALPIGKTNLDQFATGLNGTRSPWGACKNSFDPEYLSGGSSAGSSVAVALGLSTFSLGTDTAGSGRIPACFNNLVGLKPSRGLLSATGLVPACRSLDCISIFALNADDANEVLDVAATFDEADGYSRRNPYSNTKRIYGCAPAQLNIGVIRADQLEFFGDEEYKTCYENTVKALAENGATLTEIDFAPFFEAAKLLYEGPWVSERYIAAQPLIDENPDAVFPVVREIIAPGGKPKATDLFKAQYRLTELKRICDDALAQFDCILTPTAGTHFTIAEMLEEPILRNSQLGHYTNFMNLLDMTSVAVPTAFTASEKPFGITLVGPAMSDRWLLSIANQLEKVFVLPMGATQYSKPSVPAAAAANPASIDVLVCGAHLTGLPLNWQLTERGATLKQTTTTAAAYRMYALAGGPPFRPGLIRDDTNGKTIDVEIWSVPAEQFGSFVAGIPAPLGIGKVEIADGSQVCGFICEPAGVEGAEEITDHGGWKNWMKSKA